MKSSQQRLVDRGAIADSDDCKAGIFLASAEEIIDFNVGVTVVAIFHVSASAKERICFVEKQDRPTPFRCIENAAETLFCLANVFRDHGIQIDPVQVFSQAVRQSLSRDEMPGPIFAWK